MTTSSPAPVAGSLPPAPDAKIAMGWMHTARFLTTAAQLHHLPPIHVPEIAFVGRSNAGKSTCINTLTQQKQLAFASKKPGRTQHINLFALGKQGVTDAVLADLPGYGYAQAPKDDVAKWTQLVFDYLRGRPVLRRTCVLIDSRHGLKDNDREAMSLLDKSAVPYQIVFTKIDKIKASDLDKVMEATDAEIRKRPAAYPIMIATSSEKGIGIPELRAALTALTLEQETAR